MGRKSMPSAMETTVNPGIFGGYLSGLTSTIPKADNLRRNLCGAHCWFVRVPAFHLWGDFNDTAIQFRELQEPVA
jgi:hypothetical protein